MLNLLEMFQNTFSFIFIITIIVFVHELGHYYVARLAGVKVEVFSIGFGKEIFGWFDKNETRWKICLIPLGGYVKMFGDKNASSVADFEKIKNLSKREKEISFHTKPLPWKMAIVSAGPIANYILAILIMAFFFTYYGMPISEPIIDKIMQGSASEKAGFLKGDRILAIDEKEITKFSDIQTILSLNNGEELKILYQRHDEKYEINVIPDIIEKEDILGNISKTSKLGITSSNVILKKYPIHIVFAKAKSETYEISITTLKAISQIVSGKRSSDELGGPIRIAKYSGQSVKKGFQVVLWFIAILSINLGLMNLFPIPMLDGGHLFYYIIEAIRGKPISEKFQQIGFQIGLFLLIMLFAISTFNDVKNLKLF